MFDTGKTALSVVGIDIGKNSFHVVGLDRRGAIVLRQRWSRGQVDVRFANLPRCLIGMEACVGAHHLSRKLPALGHDAAQADFASESRSRLVGSPHFTGHDGCPASRLP
jgi:transposase